MSVDFRRVRHELELAQFDCRDVATQHLLNALEELVALLEREAKRDPKRERGAPD